MPLVATLRSTVSGAWRPLTSKAARAKLAAWLIGGAALIAVALYYVTQSGGLSDSSSCTDWLKADNFQQASYVNGWARLPDYKVYGPEFTSLCRQAVKTEGRSGSTNLGTIGDDVIDGHG